MLILVGVEVFTVFLICDIFLCMMLLLGRGFMLLCFMVLEFAVVLYVLYE